MPLEISFSQAPQLSELLLGVNVLDFEAIHQRLGAVDEALRGRLAGELLEAAGRLMDCRPAEAMRAGIAEFGQLQEEEEIHLEVRDY